jgi:hypothetical protein
VLKRGQVLKPSENRHEADRGTSREIVVAEGNQGT